MRMPPEPQIFSDVNMNLPTFANLGGRAVRVALAVTTCWAAGKAVADDAPAARPELVLEQLTVAHSGHELSGIAAAPKGYWAVADDKDDHYIYEVEAGKKGKRYRFLP